MAAQPRPRLLPEEYLEIERTAEFRHEYWQGEMFAMAGGSARQSVIIFNLGRELGNLLKGRPCLVMGQDMRTRVAPDGLYAYPDVVVVCGEPKFADQRQDTLVNPTLIAEVLSPSTEAYDRGFKFAQYQAIESLQEYVLVAQAEARVEVFRRQPNGRWIYSHYAGMDAVCALESLGCDSIDCRVPLREIYDKVEFDAAGGGPPSTAADA